MGDRKNIKQEKDKRSGEVFDKIERIYGRRRYLGEERKPEKCRGVDKGVRTRGSSSETRSGRGGGIQKNGVTREIHGEVVIWVG